MSKTLFHDGRATLYRGDSLEVLDALPESSVDSVVTDPPYHLTSIVKRFGSTSQSDDTVTSDRARRGADGMARLSRGFMGKVWDGGDVAFRPEIWTKVLRVVKPGGYLLAFGGTRTYHRLAVAIENAGFEVRDAIMWHYGQGFPKSHDAGNGWGTALKPATEIICMARRPLSEASVADNVRRWGTGAINIETCRVESFGGRARENEMSQGKRYASNGATNFALTPGPRGGDPLGRWPANVVHDGSSEVVDVFPFSKGQNGYVGPEHGLRDSVNVYGDYGPRPPTPPRGDVGSAARFFYAAKADAGDRFGSKHPTVKPVDLMRWLVRLVTPRGGVVLDPFAGTGTTGEAALEQGFRVVMIEREADYCADIERRMTRVEPYVRRIPLTWRRFGITV